MLPLLHIGGVLDDGEGAIGLRFAHEDAQAAVEAELGYPKGGGRVQEAAAAEPDELVSVGAWLVVSPTAGEVSEGREGLLHGRVPVHIAAAGGADDEGEEVRVTPRYSARQGAHESCPKRAA